MDRTPRLRSAFPETPRHEPAPKLFSAGPKSTPSRPPRRSVIRPSPAINATPLQSRSNGPPNGPPPHIPLHFADGPTQRMYVLAVYMALLAWKMYDWASSSGYSQTEATWLFMKWSFLDGAFLAALPLLRIPWFEWSFLAFFGLFLLHAAADFWLMFNIAIPYSTIFFYLVRTVYDRELSLSDTRVSPDKIVHNSSIILGKQTINLLPEGSAILNPELQSYCLDSARTMVELPIQINQTDPDTIELLRFDLDTDDTETIVIGAKQARKLKKEADRGHDKTDTATPRLLQYPVSKKGLYRLQRVVDKSKLEVRRRSNDVAVVPCPQASLSARSPDKCTGELSAVSLHVTGVPPFKVKYSKRINQHQFSSITQTIQSAEDSNTDNIVLDPRRPQMGWTQSIGLSVDINESLGQNGTWSYTVEEVEDGLSNKVMFENDNMKKLLTAKHTQAITVHKRPVMKFVGCDAEHFLRVAIEDNNHKMPLSVTPKTQIPPQDWPLQMRYTFTPQSGGEIPAIEEYTYDLKDEKDSPFINKAGRYDLTSLESRFCQGEINEPSSCLVYNPPRPSVNYQTEEIFDKCAGRPIGTIINFDFTGTPPFKVRYEVVERGKGSSPKVQEFGGMRGQMTLRERSAGSYQYRLLSIADEVYAPINIRSDENTFEQNIRPPAEAFFPGKDESVKACLDQPVPVDVRLLGEGPWDLEYELVHSGRRKKFTAHSDNENLVIEVPPQTEGGKYTLVLTGVQDSSRCRTALKEERYIEIRPERPRAAFGDINGKRFVEALEGKHVQLPLKLKGVSPWKVQIEHQNQISEHTFKDVNSAIQADVEGAYQIIAVHDSCPGLVDPKADKFQISWVKRPELHIRDDSISDLGGRVYRKAAVCQGEQDKFKIGLSGHSPYHLKYQVSAEPLKGQKAVSNKPLSVASNGADISLDTSKAGQYTYTFNELSDDRYAHDRKHFAPLSVKHEVYALPTVQFSQPGKTYGYCKEEGELPSEGETENIPITLTGVPPFSLDIAITHHGVSTRPEMVRIKDILSNTYSWALSRSSLGLGSHTVQIRGVKDSRNCESVIESNPSTVRIQVASPPKIIPLDSRTDYCVGDHLAFSLSGQAPFDIFYNFQNRDRKAHVASHEFKRISDHAGDFVITGIQDSVAVQGGGKCKAKQDIRKTIHPYPTVRLSHGKTLITDIHEGGEVELVFEFTGSPPFEFTYTRSENVKGLKGKPARVLETRHDSSSDFVKIIRASDEGTYEVVAIKDRHCAYSSPELAKMDGGKGQKLLT